MLFSTKAEYGVRLMIELGRQSPGRPTPLNQIAEREGISAAYLEQVVARLRAVGLVTSTRGAHGGYALARPAEEITMDVVVHALEGAIAPMDCFSPDPVHRVPCSHDAGQGQGCATKLLWTRVQLGMLRAMQQTTLAELVAFAERSQGEPALVALSS